MKKIFYILALFILTVNSVSAQKVCCPEFKLRSPMDSCWVKPSHPAGGINGDYCQSKISGCKHTKEIFAIFPQKVGYNYTWTVTGGTIASTTGNTKDITWGNGSLGTITVVISNQSGTCTQTITEKVCLIDAPIANFSFNPNSPVCANQLVQFTDASTDAKTWNWDFGDGTTSTQVNPAHSYTASGTYTITLTVSNAMNKNGPTDIERHCSCSDTMIKTITVGEVGIQIIPGCKQMLCKGDKASYSTASPCSNYNWSVTGGHIDGSATGETVNVIWDGSYPATVNMTGTCIGKCGNSGTLNVPVLYPTMPILGDVIVCPSDFSTYSLPSMPGTNYTWTISGGGFISGNNADTSVINVNWGNAVGDYTITCNYANSLTKCNGTASIKVQILPHFKISGSANGCENTAFSYTANGNANWTITPSSGTSPATFSNAVSISGTWTTAGSYTINATPVTPTNFCSYPDAMVVTVLPTPILGAITGSTIICPGKPYVYNITSNRPGGTFNWTVTGGTYTTSGSNQNTITVTWNAVGPYTLAVNQTVSSCSAPNNQTLTVNAYTKPTITGSLTSCMDNELIYTTSTLAATGDYTWSLKDPLNNALNSALGTILYGQGTNEIHVMWHGSLSPPNTCVVQLVTCGGTDQITVTINVAPPVVISKTGTLCSTTGITLSSSITGTSYVWELDNVVKPTLTTQNVAITDPGTYTVTITGSNGCVSKGSIIIPKENTGFTANIAATNKTYWLCTETVNTNLVATPMPAGSYCYKWFSGVASGMGSPIGTNSPNFTVTVAGHYWCEVSICGTGCKVITDRISVRKETCGGGGSCNPNYTPDFTINTTCNPFSFTTTNVPYSGGNAYWYFGDGVETSGSTVNHQYKGIGTYSVCARFGDATYCAKDICKTVTVNLAANFAATVNCDKVTFTNLCQVQAPSTITSYNWTFPGGSPSTSSVANPGVITYATGGLHTATLTITDGHCPVTFSNTFTTTAIPASMNLPTPICTNSVVPFSVPGSNPDLSYQWNFGDGFISNLQNTGHTYATSGTKIVTLTVTHKNGCSTILTQNITVLPAITASIGGDKKLCPNDKVGLSVTPNTFTTYQWFKDGVAIVGATSATYNATQEGNYYVQVGNGTGGGCTAFSNHSTVSFYTLPIAKIVADKTQCSANSPIQIHNSTTETGATYAWTVTGPAPLTLANSAYPTATATVPGEYNFELTVTSKDGCIAKDAVCVTLVQSPTLTITAPTGQLCEGKNHTFTATGTSNTNPSDYIIKWSNGIIGNTMTTGVAGNYSATIINSAGCMTNTFAGVIKSLPDVSLFPKGCQTACWTDTINFPLPKPASGAYTVTWYDDDGTAVANVGTGVLLPLSTLQPGIHHLHATVSVGGGCEATTGILDLNIKDCTLLPECDNCKDLLSTSKAESENNFTNSSTAQINNETITFTILKPVKEVRISLADIKYYWKDPACANCKIQMIERGCLFAANANQSLGTLVTDTATASNVIVGAASNKCPDELIWNGGTVLQPGTYTISLQLSLPKPATKNCVLALEKACFHLTLIDEDCKKCETIFCKKDDPDDPNCACNDGNNWSNLFLTPSKPGIAKPRKQIICGDTMTGIESNFAYTLSGVYNCKGGGCTSTKNEITVYNQVNEIIYTHVATTLYETIIFPEKGMYSVTLTANCGGKKCTCSFRINVNSGTGDETGGGNGGGNSGNGNGGGGTENSGNPIDPKTIEKPIDDILKQTLPPDFNGEILVSQNDKTLYEKYYSFKDNVTSHTAFDLASVTKTFTAMAILKLMEDGKLKVDDAVAQYLPEFPIPEITIKMLLSHKSGLEDYLKFIDESDWDKKKNLTNADLLQFIAKNKSKVLINTPGKTFDYSNTNFALLALIIEKTSNLPYKDYLGNTFFKPLQMSDTYIMGLDNYATATKSYYKNGKMYSLRYLDLVYGDKNVYSTVQDLKKWDKALRDGKMFKKTTLDLAYAPTSTLSPYASNYGLGWKKIVTTSGKEVLYHTGWWAGNRSLLIRLPKESVMIAVVSNNNFSNINDIKKLCDLFGDYQLSNKKITNF